MLLRERPSTPARILLPAPSCLPSLPEALARRAMVFGPFDLDEPRRTPRGPLARCAAALRGLADLLEPARAEVWS